ncbi:MAG TPA: outer membrane beta-barrel protein [Terracidiphilus sp.]|nr:outer membrane beta-barrel protein [Terracidiphilus sp.]
MRLKLSILFAALILSLPACAQVAHSAQRGGTQVTLGGGIDYWKGDYSHIARFGPAAWATAEFWHGIGVIAEGHSMIAGGTNADQYKYFSGDGGLIYTYHRWRNVAPFVKAEAGFASLSFPHTATATYTHDTRTTWAMGAGFEYKVVGHIWAHADYTYDNFPNFYSTVTGQHHSLNPNGIAVGATYHFR